MLMRRLNTIKNIIFLVVLLLVVGLLVCCTTPKSGIPSSESVISSQVGPKKEFSEQPTPTTFPTVPLLGSYAESEWQRTELCLPQLEAFPPTEGSSYFQKAILAVSEPYAVYGVYKVTPEETDDRFVLPCAFYCYSTKDGAVQNELALGEDWRIEQMLFHGQNVYTLLVGKQGAGDVPYRWIRQAVGDSSSVTLREGSAPWNRPPRMAEFGGSLLLFDYDEGKRQVVGHRPDQAAWIALSLGDKTPVDLNVSAGAGHLALLVESGGAAQFQVYDAQARLVAERPLKADERVYSWHMLSDGALLYLQDLANGSHSEYKLAWLGLNGETREFKETAQLWNGQSNGNDQVIFTEKDLEKNSGLVIHVYKAQGGALEEKRYVLPYSLSKLPAYTYLAKNQVYCFSESGEKLLRLENLLH